MRQKFISFIGAVLSILLIGSQAAATSISVDADPGAAGIQNTVTVMPGSSFMVDIVVDIMAPATLNAFQFDLNFDGGLLTPTNVVDGGFLLAPVFAVPSILGAMSVQFAEATLIPVGASGMGTLATITFDALGSGMSPLTLSNVIFSAPFGMPLAIDQQNNGSVNIAQGNPPPIPEPATLLLFGTGLAGLAFWRYRKGVKV